MADPNNFKLPSTKEVQQFHTNDDVDGGEGSHHHTLGPGKNQAAGGQHDHRGGNSVALLAGTTITGSRGGNAAVASIIAALVDLGATDSTTA